MGCRFENGGQLTTPYNGEKGPKMHRHNEITDHVKERLFDMRDRIYRDVLAVEVGADLDVMAGQLKTAAASIDGMQQYIRQLRGKWYPGCDDGAPVIQYRPQIETRTREAGHGAG